ncbi:ABC transporter ATP-binding protein [Mesorhizobium sp. CCNWLW179-1]|uniref:ABC transporter ATP-binding protein n=1 Tax=unclassified Mesorhizobium TaxID=325217 RepID=UPI0030143543
MIDALKGVSLDVGKGEIVSLIGANGAGKSSLINAISRVVQSQSGTIVLSGKPIHGEKAESVVQSGLVQVPEGRQVFSSMSVYENLLMGAYSRRGAFKVSDLDRAFDLFPRLKERREQPAGLLSGGEQQMLAIGRALMSRPKLLLLDEPSMGLAPLVIADIFRILRDLRDTLGCTILLVEQNARAALKLADRGYVLTTGKVTASGPAKDLLADPVVQDAFLGYAGEVVA